MPGWFPLVPYQRVAAGARRRVRRRLVQPHRPAGFLKTRLVATLHERGIELEFSRMRLRFERGIVAENVPHWRRTERRRSGAHARRSPVATGLPRIAAAAIAGGRADSASGQISLASFADKRLAA